MESIKCPECGKEVSRKVINCPNCGYPFKIQKSEMANKYLIFKIVGAAGAIIIATIIYFVCFCNNFKSEYYIAPPKDNNFNMESVSMLEEADIALIKEYIPQVIKWYNSIDISEAQSLDFVTDEIDDIGQRLFSNKSYQDYINIFATEVDALEDKERFEQLRVVNAIYGQIAGIMMTNNIDYSLTEDTVPTITIDKDSWIELGDNIKKAIDYYYK